MQRCVLFVWLTFFSTLLLATTSTPELFPEVKKLIDIKPINDPHMDQNAYVYLMGIDAVDDNYFAVGKKVVEHINEITRESLKLGNQEVTFEDRNNPVYQYEKIKIEGKPYTYPCFRVSKLDCVKEITDHLDETQALIKSNKALLIRYQHIIAMPYYDAYSPTMITAVNPDYRMVFILSALNKTQAVKAIRQGEVDKGLKIFGQEISFAKRILAGNAELVDKMVAISLLMSSYHTLEELLDDPNMQNHLNEPQLLALLAPLSDKEQQALVNALNNELTTYLVMYATMFNDNEITPENFGDLFDPKPFPLRSAKFPYNRNQTMNEAFISQQPFINLAKLTLPESQTTFDVIDSYQRQRSCNENDLRLFCLMKIWQRYADNTVGGIFLDIAISDKKTYFSRLYDVSSYLALINVKLLIKQQQVSLEQVPVFLEQLGDRAKNPYTKNPFLWNTTRSVLSTDALTSGYGVPSNILVQKYFFSVPIRTQGK